MRSAAWTAASLMGATMGTSASTRVPAVGAGEGPASPQAATVQRAPAASATERVQTVEVGELTA